MSGMLTVFFFARLWRRAGVMTDVEFAEIRYSGKPAAVLRGFRALYLAIPINLLVLGWVTRAMIKILTISLGVNPYAAVGICFLVTMFYAVAAGLWAVLWTDLVQFVIKMTAVIVLAVFAVRAVGGMAALKAGVARALRQRDRGDSRCSRCRCTHGHLAAYPWMPLTALGVFFFVQWWAAWYPGAEPGGGGYIAQRIFSARTERDGVLATLFFQVAHYALRPWPWIITGLATIILYPNLQDKESGYVHAFVDLLPTPWRGFMLAGFAAAYMSTVGTQLNWGASYLVNDFYKRFLKQERDGEALRERVARSHGFSFRDVARGHVAALVRRRRVAAAARARRRHGARAHPALVLVAHQRVVRDQRDDRVVRDVARRARLPRARVRAEGRGRRRSGGGCVGHDHHRIASRPSCGSW